MRYPTCLAGLALGLLGTLQCRADSAPPELRDTRLRTVSYSAAEVYRLHAFVGYQIELQFDESESFVGLSAGDMDALAFQAQTNHLFIKPKALSVHTNLTVLTSRRVYRFDYSVSAGVPDPAHDEVVYALNFVYPAPPPPAVPTQPIAAPPDAVRRLNEDYWYCGDRTLQPQRVWDDGVQTHIQFGARSELPALFVRNDDDTETLLNFHVEGTDMVIQRLAHRFILRRGRLTGCMVNKGYAGSGEQLPTRTLKPGLSRQLRETDDAAAP